MAQRTSKFFNGVINDSKKIRKALFLQPATVETVELSIHSRRKHGGIDGGSWELTPTSAHATLILNPFMKMLWHGLAGCPRPINRHNCLAEGQRCALDDITLSAVPPEQEAQRWTRMLLTHPPLRKLTVRDIEERNLPTWECIMERSVEITSTSGILAVQKPSAQVKVEAAGHADPVTLLPKLTVRDIEERYLPVRERMMERAVEINNFSDILLGSRCWHK